MGQKVNPLIQRIGIIKNWRSQWFASMRNYPRYVLEDNNIRKFIKSRLKNAAVSEVIIERLSERIKIRILTGRPGIVIGRHGADIERLREDLCNIVNPVRKASSHKMELSKETTKEISIDIEEVKKAAQDAQLVAENITFQLEKRVAFRRAIKRAIEQSMSAGALGIKISVAGRLGGAEMSRRETYKQGKVPLQTLRADIDYGFAEAHTTYGLIGVKVWIYKGDILINKDKQTEKIRNQGILKENREQRTENR
jgi:small subunit ribosomal protein S3